MKTNGETKVTEKLVGSRALGIKPYSTEIEQSFFDNLKHALEIVNDRCEVRKEVPIKAVFHN